MNLTPELLAAYHDAHYIVFTPHGDITLRINQHSTALTDCLTQRDATRFAFISACNPRSVPHAADANALRHDNFKQCLREQQTAFLEGVGRSPDGHWQEASLLLFNVDQETALRWGRYLEQHAILWGDQRAIPHLLFCEPLNTSP